MRINPDWNYGYLRLHGYGYGEDPPSSDSGESGSGSSKKSSSGSDSDSGDSGSSSSKKSSSGGGGISDAAVEAGAGALTSAFNFLSTWKSSKEATKQTEIMTRQQRQADRAAREQSVSTQNLALITLAKGKQEAEAQKDMVKNVMLGVAILGVVGTGIYFANKLYFSK